MDKELDLCSSETKFEIIFHSYGPWWFSVGICKYKPGYKSHVLSLVEIAAFRLERKSCKVFFK